MLKYIYIYTYRCLGANAEPSDDNFKYEECDYPVLPLVEDEVLVRSTYLSIDPALVIVYRHLICVN